MSRFFDAWKQSEALARDEVFATVRPFTLAVVERWLRAHVPAVREEELNDLRKSALMRHLSDGKWVPFDQTDSWKVPGENDLRLSIKTFGHGFQAYDTLQLALPGHTQVYAGVKVTMDVEGQDVRLKDVYVGILSPAHEAFHYLTLESYPLAVPESVPKVTAGRTSGRTPTPYVGVLWTRNDIDSEDELIAQAATVLEAARLKVAENPSPFPQLTEVKNMAVSSGLTAEALRAALESQGFRFSSAQIATFYAALKAKGFVLLSGLSGTGKTALAQRLLGLMGVPDSHVLLTAVRPDWRDTQSLLGYLNPLTREYQATPLLRFLLEAQADFLGDRPALEDYLATYLAEPKTQEWYKRYAETVARFAGRQPGGWSQGQLVGEQTRQEHLFAGQGSWSQADLQLLWHRKDNGIADVGQWAPKLQVDEAVLRAATDKLADQSHSPGERYLAVLADLRAATGINHFSRTARVLAALDPEHVPPEVGEAQTRVILDALESKLKFAPGAKDATAASLEAVWKFTIEKATDLLKSIGRDPNDAILRGIALWGVYLWGRGGSSNAASGSAMPHVVILDEMNLARVEYYFADFLSAMESDRADDGLHTAEIVLHTGGEIRDQDGHPVPEILRLPPNVYFVGTVNVDESTFSFSPKVLDRAFTIEFRDVDLAGYPFPPSTGAPAATFALPPDFTRSGRFAGVDKAAVSAQAEAESVVLERLRDLHKTLQPYGLEFGYRVVDEVLQFLAALGDAPVIDGLPRSPEDLAFDTALCMKVLPKFHGPFRHLEPGLTAVRTWAQDLGLDMTVKKIDDMVRRGLGQGHVSFF